MFVPIGKRGENQFIYLIDKDYDGEIKRTQIMCVNYGMLTDKYSQLYQ